MAEPGKISQGLHEKAETLIAGEEVLFGQAVSYDSSDDEKGVKFEWSGSGGAYPAGIAVYDPAKGSAESRRYEQYDVMKILKEGTVNVRIQDQTGSTSVDITKGDPLYAIPDGYIGGSNDLLGDDDTQPYLTMAPNGGDGSIAGSGYFGPPIATAKESSSTDGAVIKAEVNLPDMKEAN